MIPETIIPGTTVAKIKPGYDRWLSTQCDTRGMGKWDNEIVRVLPPYTLEQGKEDFGEDWQPEPDDGSRLCVNQYDTYTRIPARFLEKVEAL